MWWGGGGGHGGGDMGSDSPPSQPDGASPPTHLLTSPISIRGRSDESSPLSSSFGSSLGSPSSDLRELRNLRHQFDDQEELLGQIRDALQTTATNQSKNEDYASRLAQMRQKGKSGEKKKTSTPIKKELPTSQSPPELGGGSGGKKTRGAKMQVLRKQLEETRARQEAEASSRKDLEDMVSNLQQEICKRDSMIASLQLSSVNSSVISSPFVMSPEAVSPDLSPGSVTPPYKGVSDYREQLSAKDNKILELSEQVASLGRQVFDLEESLKEKDEVIAARTQAVGLAAASVSAKGRNTLDQLEDTRAELRRLQAGWAEQEAEWRRERETRKIEAEAAAARLDSVNAERAQLERVQTELETKAGELRGEISGLGEQLGEVKSRAREDRILLEARQEELEEDNARLKNQLKQKEEIHQSRVSELERLLEGVEEAGETEDRQLEICLAEKEEEKGNLQLRILELEETISAEGRMKTQLTEVRENLRRCEDDLETQNRATAMMEAEKLDLMEALASRDDMLTGRLAEVGRLTGELEEAGRAKLALEMRCLELEELRDRWEGDRLELVEKIEEEKENCREAMKPLEELKAQHEALKQEHEQFKQEHTAALEKSKLYDTDLLDKYNKIKELKAENASMHKMVQEKNQELSAYFPFIEEKDALIKQLRNDISNLEDSVCSKDKDITRLNTMVQQSDDVTFITGLQDQVTSIEQQLTEANQQLKEKDMTIGQLSAVKEQLAVDLDNLVTEKINAVNELEKKMEDEVNRFKGKLCEKDAMIEGFTKELEHSRIKMDSLVEEVAEKSREVAEKSDALKIVEDKSIAELSASDKQLDSVKTELDSCKHSMQTMEEDYMRKTALLDQKIEDLESCKMQLDGQLNDLHSEKSALQTKFDAMEKSLTLDISTIREEAKLNQTQFEQELATKNEDVAALNEDMMLKYKTIEGLQNDIVQLEYERDAKQDEIGVLTTRVDTEYKATEQLRQQLAEKDSALTTLQAVVDVLKSESSESDEKENAQFGILESRIEALQSELVAKNLQLDAANTLQAEQTTKCAELTSRVTELDAEIAENVGAAECMNLLRQEFAQKREECEALNDKLIQLRADLEVKDRALFTHQEQELSQRKLTAAEDDVSGADNVKGDFQSMQEQIEMLRAQVARQADLLTGSTSDAALRELVSELTDQVELRTQEVEDVKTLLRRTEADKRKAETQLTEAEQFRTELVKESNQHAEESGEKMRELKLQLDNEKEELANVIRQKNAITTEAETAKKSLQSLRQQLEQEQLRHDSSSSVTGQAGDDVTMANLMAERDAAKDKNEKLKDMCKKYLAKLKQQEALLKASNNISNSGNTVPTLDNSAEEKYKEQIRELRNDISTLNNQFEDLKTILQNTKENCLQLEMELSQTTASRDSEIATREQAIAEKDDLIRTLKQKLENAPEDITVAMPTAADDVAHQQTKNELAALKEKCKKLIVKVKQQDALLKKESAKIRSESVVSVSSIGSDSPLGVQPAAAAFTTATPGDTAIQKELEAEKIRLAAEHATAVQKLEADRLELTDRLARIKTEHSDSVSCLEAEKSKLAEEYGSVVQQLETERGRHAQTSEENAELRRRIADEADLTATTDSLQAKIGQLSAERSGLYDAQIQLKAEIKDLKVDRQAEKNRVADLQAKIKSMHEQNLIAQMAASPMLQALEAAEAAGCEEDDGWISPEPVVTAAIAQQQQHAITAAMPVIEDDGLMTPEPGNLAAVSGTNDTVGEGNSSAGAIHEDGSDGWGGGEGWQDPIEEAQEGDGWENDWGGDAELPELPEPKPVAQPKVNTTTAERQADIEDGWGDDTWIGFEPTATEESEPLAETIPGSISAEVPMAVSVGSGGEIETSPTDGWEDGLGQDEVVSQEAEPLPKSSKDAEMELVQLKERYQDLEEELIQVQEKLDESEKNLRKISKEKTRLEKIGEEDSHELVRLQQSIDNLQSQIKNEKLEVEDDLSKQQELEALHQEVKQLKATELLFTELQKKYETANIDLETSLSSKAVLEEQLSTLEHQHRLLQASTHQMEAAMQEDTRKMEESKQTSSQELDAKSRQFDETLKAKRKEMEDLLQKKGDDMKALEMKVEEMEGILRKKSEDMEALEIKRKEMEENLQLKSQEMEEALSAKDKEKDEIAAVKERLENQLNQAQKELEDAEAERTCLTESLRQAEEKSNSIGVEMGDLESSVSACNADNLQLKEKIQALESSHPKEVDNLRSLLDEMGGESERQQACLADAVASNNELQSRLSETQADYERLQQELHTAQASLAGYEDRVRELQEEMDRLRMHPVQNQPPPDVTNPVPQPDVARGSRQNPPDIMPGNNLGLLGMGGQAGDIIGGQLDLVHDNAVSWFDSFADNSANDGNGGNPVQEYGQAPVQPPPHHHQNQQQPADVQHQQQQLADAGQEERRAQLQAETEQLKIQLSEAEAKYKVLEQAKAVIEQSQTQLIADFKQLYDKSCRDEEHMASCQSAAADEAASLNAKIASLQQQLNIASEENTKLLQKQQQIQQQQLDVVPPLPAAMTSDSEPDNRLASFFDSPQPASAAMFPSLGQDINDAFSQRFDNQQTHLQPQQSQLQQQLDQLEAELTASRAQLAQVQELSESQAGQIVELEASREQLKSAQELCDSLAGQVAELGASRDQLTLAQQLSDSQTVQIAELERKLAQAAQFSAELTTKSQATDDQEASEQWQLQSELAATQSRLSELSDVHVRTLEELAACNTQINQLNAKLVVQHEPQTELEEKPKQLETAVEEKIQLPVPSDGLVDEATSSQQMASTAQLFFDDSGQNQQPPAAAQHSAAGFFDGAISGTDANSAAAFFLSADNSNTAAESLPTASQYFADAADEQPMNSTAAAAEVMKLFTAATASDHQQIEGSVSETPAAIYDPFSEHHETNLQQKEPLTSVTEPTAEPANDAATTIWQLQQEIASYQTAIVDWQAWGAQQTEQLTQLQQQLETLTEAYNNSLAQQQSDKCSDTDSRGATITSTSPSPMTPAATDEKLPTTARPDDKVNEVLKLLKIKDLELEELKETIDRLETEKVDALEELRETKEQVKELDAATEQMEIHRNTVDQLEELKASHDQAKDDRTRLTAELATARQQLTAQAETATTETGTLQRALAERTAEVGTLTSRIDEALSRQQHLELQLAEEKRLQEEVATEFEDMQQQALMAGETAGKLDAVQQQLAEKEQQCEQLTVQLEQLTAQLEQAKQLPLQQDQQQLRDARLQCEQLTEQLASMQQQVEEQQVLRRELESLKQSVLREGEQTLAAAANSTPHTDDVTPSSTDMSSLSQAVDRDNADNTDRLALLEQEVETYKQHLADWNVWSETKTAEYDQLLAAYNAYVEAYNTMSTEYNSLKSSGSDESVADILPKQLDIERANVTALQSEIVRLSAELQQHAAFEADFDKSSALITAKDEEIVRLTGELTAKEAELKEKAADIARLSIKTRLGNLVAAHKQAETSVLHQPTLTIAKQTETSVEPDAGVSLPSSVPAEIGGAADWSESDGWGDSEAVAVGSIGDDQARAIPEQVNQLELEISQLRREKLQLDGELNNAKLKNGKLLVKVKTLTKQMDALKKSSMAASSSTGSGFVDDLDKALEEEMNNQVEKAKTEVKEVRREMETLLNEKEAMLAKIDTLEAANIRLTDMKEQQDLEVEYLRGRSKEAKEQVEGLQWQLAEVEERARVDQNELQMALLAYQENAGTSEDGIREENAKLRLDLKTCREDLNNAQLSLDKLRQDVTVLTASLEQARIEVDAWRSQAQEAEEEVESLKLHIETLQNEKGGSEEYLEAMRLNQTLNNEISSLKSLIEGQPMTGDPSSAELLQLRDRMKREQQLVLQLEQDLRARDQALEEAHHELRQMQTAITTGGAMPTERVRRESTDSRFSLDRDVFTDQEVLTENHRLRSDLDSTVKENRRLTHRIKSWEQELSLQGQNVTRDPQDLSAELSRAIKTLQIKDNKCDELTQENLRLLEERDTLQLRLSAMMRQMESACNSRAITPVPGGAGGPGQQLPLSPGGLGMFDPALQIKELHTKLEELRKLNYALDVELQQERGQRQEMQVRIMEPRNREAEAMLGETDPDTESSPVKHM